MTTPPRPAYPYPGGWTPPPQQMRMVPASPAGAPLADFWHRLGAYMLDAVIVGAFTGVIAIGGLAVWVVLRFNQVDLSTGADPALEVFVVILVFEVVVILLSLIFSYAYFVEYQLRKRQTVGKKILKIMIMPVDPCASLARGDYAKRWAVGHLLGAVLPFFSYLDGFWQLWDKPLQQCLHDKAAKTVVVRVG